MESLLYYISKLSFFFKKSKNLKLSQKCILIDNQECDPNGIEKIRAKFKSINFDVIEFKNSASTELLVSLRSVVNHEKIDLSCLVVCIFASYPSQTNTSTSNLTKGFVCQDGQIFTLNELVKFFNEELLNKFPVYVLINDKKKPSVSSAVQNEFHFLYQKSNVYISFNTYPDSWFIQKLCKNFQLIENVECKNDCQTLARLSRDVCEISNENQIVQNSSTSFTEAILSVSLNTNHQIRHTTVQLKDEAYDFHQPLTGICLILNFNLERFGQFTKCENIDQNVKQLEESFKNLGLRVNSFKYFELTEIVDYVHKFDQSAFNCFVLCMFTHCENGKFYYYEKVVEVKDKIEKISYYLKYFSLNRLLDFLLNPSLTNKPKFVLINDPYKYNAHENQIGSIDSFDYLASIPKHLLISHSTFANVDQNSDSYFIRMFCEVLEKFSAQKYDLFAMLQLATLHLKRNFSQANVLVKSTLDNLFIINKNENLNLKNEINREIGYLMEPFVWQKNLERADINGLFYPFSCGKCLLLNYTNDGESCCSQDDLDTLKQTFKNLQFDVLPLKDLSIYSWELSDEDSIYDCFVVFIINGNSELIERDTLFRIYNNFNFAEKPKLFFVLGPDNIKKDKQPLDSFSKYKDFKSIDIPKYSNFLYFYCDKISATIQLLCSELNTESGHFDLNTLLAKVVQKNSDRHIYYNSTLTQLLSFKKNKEFDASMLKPIACDKKGICFILNYIDFDDDYGKQIERMKRKGTVQDEKNLEEYFRSLNFEVIIYQNLNRDKTTSLLEKISKYDFSSYGCFVMCYMTHGDYDGELSCRREHINRDDLFNAASKNSKLDNKPKIFFIQACQGGMQFEEIRTIVQLDSSKQKKNATKWDYPDIFVFAGSYPGYLSYRHEVTGSYFIQALCEFLKMPEYDLATIAAIVCRDVGYYNSFPIEIKDSAKKDSLVYKNVKQIPFLHSTMTTPVKLTSVKSGLSQIDLKEIWKI